MHTNGQDQNFDAGFDAVAEEAEAQVASFSWIFRFRVKKTVDVHERNDQ